MTFDLTNLPPLSSLSPDKLRALKPIWKNSTPKWNPRNRMKRKAKNMTPGWTTSKKLRI